MAAMAFMTTIFPSHHHLAKAKYILVQIEENGNRGYEGNEIAAKGNARNEEIEIDGSGNGGDGKIQYIYFCNLEHVVN